MAAEITKALNLKPLGLRDSDALFLTMDHTGKSFVGQIAVVQEEEVDIPQDDLSPDAGDLFAMCAKREVRKTIVEGAWPSWGSQGFHERLPDSKWLGQGGEPALRFRYTFAATDFTALAIHSLWPKEQIYFSKTLGAPESDSKLVYEHILKRTLAHQKRAEMCASFKLSLIQKNEAEDKKRKYAKEGGEDPEILRGFDDAITEAKKRLKDFTPKMPETWVEHPEYPLDPYQKVGVLFALHSSAALFFDRGLGKTPAAIGLISELSRRKQPKPLRVLTLCPNQVRQNWVEETHRFVTAPGKTVVLRGTQENRLKLLVQAMTPEKDCHFTEVVCGYDTLSVSMEGIGRIPWDLVIMDESQKFKSATTKRWKAIRDINATQVLLLSGSPIGNQFGDLWTQLEALGEGMSGFTTEKKFRKFHGQWAPMGFGVEKLVGIDNMPVLQERLTRTAFSLSKKEAGLRLPKKLYSVIEVEMTKKQGKIYDEAASSLVVEVENMLSGTNDAMTIEHALVMMLRLAQITSGFVTFDAICDEMGDEKAPRRIEQIDDPNPKISAVLEDLKEELEGDPNAKAIIWCHWLEDIRWMSRILAKEGIDHRRYYGAVNEKDRDEAVKAFNGDPKCKVMVCNAVTAGEGLNLVGYDWWEKTPKLDTYTTTEYFLSQSWSYLDRAQAEDRAHRRGTRVPVRIVDVVVPGTIDEEIRKRVTSKKKHAMEVLDVRGMIENILAKEHE